VAAFRADMNVFKEYCGDNTAAAHAYWSQYETTRPLIEYLLIPPVCAFFRYELGHQSSKLIPEPPAGFDSPGRNSYTGNGYVRRSEENTIRCPGLWFDIPAATIEGGAPQSTMMGLRRIAARDFTPATDSVRTTGHLMLTDQNIESELSYAYLHAVASRAGFSCEYRNRHLDGAGIDATITEDGRRLAYDSILTSFSVDIQLKATCRQLPESEGRLSYVLSIPHYDKLRLEALVAPRLLVLMRLPQRPEEWLEFTEEALVAKRCAYWVSLRGASASANNDYQTVYVPRANLLSTEGLTNLMASLSRLEVMRYVA
jgi:hypothetical protein